VNSVTSSHQTRFLVPADHPALPGHFPGSPVVPGVVVLDHVLKAGEAWLGRPLGARGLRQVKFQSALLPGESADVSLEIVGESLSFRVSRAGQPIAQGAFILADAADLTAPHAHDSSERS
jgi:3-hydroxymyristoyl/3-hydroxydecanoyl-(acyl carrier protein) dehydratase